MKTKNKGFTLVEIMIVVVIIGLLASMAIPAFQKVRTNSQDKAVLNNARQLSAASDQYYLENGGTRRTSGSSGIRPMYPRPSVLPLRHTNTGSDARTPTPIS